MEDKSAAQNVALEALYEELIIREEKYLSRLQTVIEVFLKPMKTKEVGMHIAPQALH
jgi:hypothetical protein